MAGLFEGWGQFEPPSACTPPCPPPAWDNVKNYRKVFASEVGGGGGEGQNILLGGMGYIDHVILK